MIVGAKTHVTRQLTEAILKQKTTVEVQILDKDNVLNLIVVPSLPKSQTSGTSTQQHAHANQLAQGIVSKKFNHLR